MHDANERVLSGAILLLLLLLLLGLHPDQVMQIVDEKGAVP